MFTSKPLAALIAGAISLASVGTYIQKDVRTAGNQVLRRRLVAFPGGTYTYILRRSGTPVGIDVLAYHPHGDSLDITETTRIRLAVPGGGMQEVSQSATETLGPTLALERFHMSVSAQTSRGVERTDISGIRDRTVRDRIHAVITTSSHTSHVDVTLDTTAVLGSGTWPVLAVARQLSPHKAIHMVDFDPTTLHGRPMTLVFGDGHATRMFMDSPETIAYDITQVSGGITTKMVVTALGVPVTARLPLGISSAPAMPQDVAAWRSAWAKPAPGGYATSAPDSADESIIAASAIQAGATVAGARNLTSMVVRVHGDTLPSAARGDGQSVKGDLLTVTRQELPAPGHGGYVLGGADPFAEDSVLDSYTKPEPFLESDSPEIKATLAEAVPASDRTDPVLVSVHVTRWVYRNLKKEYTASLPSAIEVARVRAGDCNEHTALATAMLRAAGIPTRPVSGLALVGKAFYFHAWVEVWLGGHWVPLDPTFGLAPADPARVRLASDWSNLTSVLMYLGNLGLDVQSAR